MNGLVIFQMLLSSSIDDHCCTSFDLMRPTCPYIRALILIQLRSVSACVLKIYFQYEVTISVFRKRSFWQGLPSASHLSLTLPGGFFFYLEELSSLWGLILNEPYVSLLLSVEKVQLLDAVGSLKWKQKTNIPVDISTLQCRGWTAFLFNSSHVMIYWWMTWVFFLSLIG